MKIKWIELSKQVPVFGEYVLIFRDYEVPKLEYVEWTEEEEFYANWNNITHWCKINLPVNQ